MLTSLRPSPKHLKYVWVCDFEGDEILFKVEPRGVARIFQRWGHTGSNNIVMAFSPRNIVGCLLKKRLTKGGHGHPRTPLATPLVEPWNPNCRLIYLSLSGVIGKWH